VTRLAGDAVNRQWQTRMAPVMDVAAGMNDGSTAYLEEVFHLD